MILYILKLIAFLAFNFIIFALWYIHLYRQIGRYFTFIEVILASFVMYLVQIVATQLILGVVFHALTWLTLLLLNIIILVFLISASKKADYDLMFKEVRAKIVELKNLIFRNKWILILTVLSAAVSVWIFFIAFAFNDNSFDSQNYHLAWAGNVIQEKSITIFSTPVPWINLYPKSMDMWYVWNLIFLQNDLLVDFSQYIFVLIGIISIYSILKNLDIRKPVALFSSMLYFFIPLVILQSTTNYIDLAVSSMFLLFLSFAFDRQITLVHAFILGAVGGILVGSKATCLVWVAIAFIFYFLRAIRCRIGSKKLINTLLLFLGPLAILSAYWYLRNWIIYGSPIHPFAFFIGDHAIIPGVIPQDMIFIKDMPEIFYQSPFWKNLLYNFYLPIKSFSYDVVPGGFGLIWSYLLFPFAIFAIIPAIIKRNWKFLGLTAVFWLAYFLTPANWWLRYVMFFTGWGIIGFAYLLNMEFNKYYKYVILSAAIALSLWSVYASWKPADVDLSFIKSGKFAQRDFSQKWGNVFSELYKYNMAGTTIAYDSYWFVVYPLWNQELSNRVVHSPLEKGKEKEWLNWLDEQDVDLLAIKDKSPEYNYIQEHLDNFELLVHDKIYGIYKVKK